MMRERLVPYTGLSFVVVAALALGTIVARSPDTHGHLWKSVPADYDRTPLDTIRDADPEAIQAELPPFAWPTTVGEMAGHAVGPAEAHRPAAGPSSKGGAAEAARPTPAEVQRVTLTESEFAITPDRVTLKAGVPVELVVVNEGQQTHGLWLPDFGIAQDVRSGKTEVFRFTPDKPGRYRYTCSYNLCGTEEQHARMVGFLTVQ